MLGDKAGGWSGLCLLLLMLYTEKPLLQRFFQVHAHRALHAALTCNLAAGQIDVGAQPRMNQCANVWVLGENLALKRTVS